MNRSTRRSKGYDHDPRNRNRNVDRFSSMAGRVGPTQNTTREHLANPEGKVSSSQDLSACSMTALAKIVQVRYHAFCERFGRDPKPHEPLLFDITKDEPTPADVSDQVLQVISAALLSEVDAGFVLDYLGLTQAIDLQNAVPWATNFPYSPKKLSLC